MYPYFETVPQKYLDGRFPPNFACTLKIMQVIYGIKMKSFAIVVFTQ